VYHIFTEPFSFNYVFRNIDNDDGYTVVDINDFNKIKFRFVYYLNENRELSIYIVKDTFSYITKR
jgi:hypothetical protein